MVPVSYTHLFTAHRQIEIDREYVKTNPSPLSPTLLTHNSYKLMTLPHPLKPVPPSLQLLIFLANSLCFSVVCVSFLEYNEMIDSTNNLSIVAVSYTHLDVYKRQSPHSVLIYLD